MTEQFVTPRQAEASARMAHARAVKAANTAALEPIPAPAVDEIPPGHVRVRIMKKGDDKIFTGATCPLETIKFPTFRKGDETTMARDTADKYEDLGMVEIL